MPQSLLRTRRCQSTQKIQIKQVVINLDGVPEDECFKYSILATTYQHKIMQTKTRTGQKRCFGEVNFNNILEPTNMKDDITKFEE